MRTLLIALLMAALLPARAAGTQEDAAALKSLEALYALDYASSLEHIRSHIVERPDDPAGYLFEAGISWWWETAEPGTLKSRPGFTSRFKRDIKTGLELSKARFKSESAEERADAYFTAGLLLGIRAQWNLSRRRWLKAYLDGRKGKKFQKRCLEIDPEYYDAYLGIGLHNYLAGTLPGILKIGMSLLIRGDAEKGKEQLLLATEKGRYRFAATQAASNLVSLYILYEKDHPRALEVLRGLLKEFPDSPYFRFLEILSLDGMGDWDASHERALALYGLASQDPEILRGKRFSTFCGVAASQCLKPRTLRPVVVWLNRALEKEEKGPEGWRTILRLYRGAARDALGDREKAVADYRTVLSLPDVADSHAFAGRCMKKRCRKRALLRILRNPL
ncbi:tetratricopeptide repeat protein [Elusimicrobiota bacterium]